MSEPMKIKIGSKPIQITSNFHPDWGHFYSTICEDGTMWVLENTKEGWKELPKIPNERTNFI